MSRDIKKTRLPHMASPRPRPSPGSARTEKLPAWTFLTNHGHVLVCIARNPDARLAEIADTVGIGERATHRIVSELVGDGYVVRSKQGRCNRYSVDYTRPLRHPLEAEHTIGEIFRSLAARSVAAGPRPGRAADVARDRR